LGSLIKKYHYIKAMYWYSLHKCRYNMSSGKS